MFAVPRAVRIRSNHASPAESAGSPWPFSAAAATTLRKDREPPLVLDGPFAETKEQLLGFYVVDCDSLDGALQIAKDLGKANPGGSYEIRPIAMFQPGPAGA